MHDAARNLPTSWIRRHAYATLVFCTLALLLIPLHPAPATSAARAPSQLLQLAAQQPTALVDVIVQQVGPDPRIKALVAQLGGLVLRELPIIQGFAVRLPARALPDLARAQSVKWVSLDAPMRPAGAAERPSAQTVNGRE